MRLWAHEGLRDVAGGPCAASGLDLSPESARELWGAGLESLGIHPTKDDPVHLVVDSPERRVQSDLVRNHVWSTSVPAGSFHRLAPGVLIASPGFCCLQAAARSSTPRVMALEMECLGLYGRVGDARGVLDRNPIVTIDKLRIYLEAARPSPGANKALRALDWCMERSRSPLETKTAIILMLTPRLGGYGLPIPELNYPIRAEAGFFGVSQYASYEVDMCWPGRRTIVECDSYAYHCNSDQLDRDAKRRNSLEAMGWKVVSVTSGQLSGDSLDVLARQVAKDLGVRVSQPLPERRDWLLSQLV